MLTAITLDISCTLNLNGSWIDERMFAINCSIKVVQERHINQLVVSNSIEPADIKIRAYVYCTYGKIYMLMYAYSIHVHVPAGKCSLRTMYMYGLQRRCNEIMYLL